MGAFFRLLQGQNEDTSSRPLVGHSNSINYEDFSDDLRFLASASCDKTIKLWKISSNECWRTLAGHQDCVSSVIFLPGSTELVSASCDNTIKLWNVESGECLRTLEGHQDCVNFVLFLPDMNRLVSASCDKTIKIWDLKTGLVRLESAIVRILREDNQDLEHGKLGVREDLEMSADMRQLSDLLGQLEISGARAV
ncbi:periodic tryptophan protein-like protein [Alternaria alternata]|nr:periodic tryptophan protein-like protein [Alternaria alternata]